MRMTKVEDKKYKYRIQLYKKEWEIEEWAAGWLKMGKTASKGYCIWCDKEIISGKSELRRHASSRRHLVAISEIIGASAFDSLCARRQAMFTDGPKQEPMAGDGAAHWQEGFIPDIQNFKKTRKRKCMKRMKKQLNTEIPTNTATTPSTAHSNSTMDDSNAVVSATNPAAITAATPSPAHSDSIVVDNLNENEDEHDVFSKTVGFKLRKMKPEQSLIAEKLINDILFRGSLEQLTTSSYFVTNSVTLTENSYEVHIQ